MIFWKDFQIDDEFGPLLADCRSLRSTHSSVMEDTSPRALIQETRRDAEPLPNANTGCVRGKSWTQVHVQGQESDLETNARSHEEVTSGNTGLRQRGVG